MVVADPSPATRSRCSTRSSRRSRPARPGCSTSAAAPGPWPRRRSPAGRGVRVTGVDVVGGHARGRGSRARHAARRRSASRIDLVQAPADRLPFEDGSFDIAVTTFVLQLVPSAYRAAARGQARAARRAARSRPRPGWTAAGSTRTTRTATRCEAAGIEPPDARRRPRRSRARPRRRPPGCGGPGSSGSRARGDGVDHAFTPEALPGVRQRFDDEDLLDDDGRRTTREALEPDLLARLEALGRRRACGCGSRSRSRTAPA